MAQDPRLALNRLIAAFEHHYDASRAAKDGDGRGLEAAEERLRDAFFTYDDELFTTFEVELPFDLLDDFDDDFDEDDDEVLDILAD
ncbi:DNA primase [Schaalia sp. 19OD2882]|uniref:DNA primase n=1 Tax=Schaalia sp. 19OD2882 TaxID=2794089 RepID=UPI001C1EC962|nr:DNA primase [Schaalia sp. 19OD2882]QWW18730.1 DNA primase [Schaalia sp. 19OD2882]